eukprot:COSAG01_NODE_824_length_13299_cov_22.451364_15_plen_64_part_00
MWWGTVLVWKGIACEVRDEVVERLYTAEVEARPPVPEVWIDRPASGHKLGEMHTLWPAAAGHG